jgi:hypothetical protein
MARRKSYGFSFSWKRATGISSMKRKIAKATGIPTTRSGRQRKVGKMMGCLVYVIGLIGLVSLILVLVFI